MLVTVLFFFKHGLLAFSKTQVLSLCCAFENFLRFIDNVKNNLKLERICPYSYELIN